MTEQAQTKFAKDQLKSIIERIERLEEEKKAAADDIRDVYAEAKGNGFDVTALRAIVKMRKQDTDERREQQQVLETYMHALGMLSDTPLGQAALDRVAKQGTTARMKQTADLAQEAANKGFISQDAADTTKAMAEKIAERYGEPIDEAVKRAANSPRVQRAIKAMGTPVELTDEEREKGYSAAFIGKDGTRMAIGAGPDVMTRNPGNSGSTPPPQSPPPQSPPPAAPPPAAACSLDVPADGSLPMFLRRGHPDCTLGAAPH